MVHKSKKFKSNDVAEMETDGKLDDVDNFMIEFKRLKQRQPPPDLSDVLEFESEESRQKNVRMTHKNCIILGIQI